MPLYGTFFMAPVAGSGIIISPVSSCWMNRPSSIDLTSIEPLVLLGGLFGPIIQRLIVMSHDPTKGLSASCSGPGLIVDIHFFIMVTMSGMSLGAAAPAGAAEGLSCA